MGAMEQCEIDPPGAGAQRPPASGRGSDQIAIGVVDPVPLYRDGITALFDRTPGVRLLAHSASEQGAVNMSEQLRPDLVVLDSGLDPHGHLVRRLTGTPRSPRVVVLVRPVHQTAKYLASTMASGAHCAVPRSAEPGRLIEAIRHAHNSRRYLDPAFTSLVTGAANGAVVTAGRVVPRPKTRLSKREFQVLELIAEGLENAAIAKVLFLSVETVRTHVKGILRKLGARDRTHAVTIAFRSRLLTVPPEVMPSPAKTSPARAVGRGVV